MALNIKNERVHRLAREAARLSGRTQTGAIEEALERLIESYGADPSRAAVRSRLDAVRRISAAYSSDRGVAEPGIATVEDLYDEHGLPR